MMQLCGKPEQEITDELAGAIFRNPVTQQWETSDEYLSGNVRENWPQQKPLWQTMLNIKSMWIT